MALQGALFGYVAERVLSCLNAQDLSWAEMVSKGVDREATRACWEALASEERRALEWRPGFLESFPDDTDGKDALQELLQLRRHLAGIPVNWSPQIRAVSASSLQVSSLVMDADTAAEGGTVATLVPLMAAVPLALGIIHGEPMSVGIQIHSKVKCANEGVWLSLEFPGLQGGVGMYMSVQCAPLTGRCMMTFPGHEGDVLVSQAMQPLADDHCDAVEIYVTVSESGDVEFVRFCPAANSIDRSGRMPRKMFPGWTTEMFASISIEMEHMPFETTVSTSWSADGLPQEVQSQLESGFTYDAAWSVRD